MTVKELIDQLKDQPEDAQVLLQVFHDEVTPLVSVSTPMHPQLNFVVLEHAL